MMRNAWTWATLLALGAAAGSGAVEAQVRVNAFAAIAPEARSSYAGGPPATFFVSLVNATPGTLTGCQPHAPSFPVGTTYQTVSASNQLTGTPNTPVSVGGNDRQGFVVTIPPTAITSHTVTPEFACDQGRSIRTPALSATYTVNSGPLPDIVAISATQSGDGIARIASAGGATFMAVAGVNIGGAGTVDVIADDSAFMSVPAVLAVCETNPATSACLAAPAASVRVSFAANQTRTFGVFASASPGSGIPLWPDAQRIKLSFREISTALTVGETSAAITAPAPAGAATGPSLWSLHLDDANGTFSNGVMAFWGDGRAMASGVGAGVWDGSLSEWLWSIPNGSVVPQTTVGENWAGAAGNVLLSNGHDTTSSAGGVITPRTSILGSYGLTQGRVLRAVMDGFATDLATSTAALAGEYSIMSGAFSIGNATINANGTWSGQYTLLNRTACRWSGAFTQEAGRNFFTAAMNFDAVVADCPQEISGRSFKGFATRARDLSEGKTVVMGYAAQETVGSPEPLAVVLRRK